MLFLEDKYAGLLGHRLEQFRRLKPGLYNFRCPICGDSAKSKRKARGYFYVKDRDDFMRFMCHNCAAQSRFTSFLKKFDPETHRLYKREEFEWEAKPKEEVPILDRITYEKPVFKTKSPFSSLSLVSDLPREHPARSYLELRLVPEHQLSRVRYAPEFFKWTDEVVPGKFPIPDDDEERIVFPFISETGDFVGFSARLISDGRSRYLVAMFGDAGPKLWGMDRIDRSCPIYAFEGQIDAMMIDNCIAAAGSISVEILRELGLDKQAVVVFDNERRHPHTTARMKKVIKAGCKICIWPERMAWKDANEAVMALHSRGMSLDEARAELLSMLREGTKSGLAAELELNRWKMV